jgi:hypothetical protein
MTLRISDVLMLGGAAMLASCSTGQLQETPSPKDQKELADALAGRTPGPPIRCIRNYQTTQMQVIDDWTILFRDGSTIYVQNPRGGCPGLANGGYTLVTRSFGTNDLCDGDFNQMVDLVSKSPGGACIFGPFVPYNRPN